MSSNAKSKCVPPAQLPLWPPAVPQLQRFDAGSVTSWLHVACIRPHQSLASGNEAGIASLIAVWCWLKSPSQAEVQARLGAVLKQGRSQPQYAGISYTVRFGVMHRKGGFLAAPLASTYKSRMGACLNMQAAVATASPAASGAGACSGCAAPACSLSSAGCSSSAAGLDSCLQLASAHSPAKNRSLRCGACCKSEVPACRLRDASRAQLNGQMQRDMYKYSPHNMHRPQPSAAAHSMYNCSTIARLPGVLVIVTQHRAAHSSTLPRSLAPRASRAPVQATRFAPCTSHTCHHYTCSTPPSYE